MAAEIRIGTSEWHYKHWIGRYYPNDIHPSQMLSTTRAASSTVELNNSFYWLPTEEAFESWRKTTPTGFRFAVRGSRF